MTINLEHFQFILSFYLLIDYAYPYQPYTDLSYLKAQWLIPIVEAEFYTIFLQ